MPETPPPTYTLSELEERSGVAARNIRFYTTREMLPPPRRDGRSAVYGPEHLVRLELIRELQAHGFTLAAIATYLERVPRDGSPDVIRLHSRLLAPWMSDRPERLSRDELVERAGRDLSEDDLETLQALGMVQPGEDGLYEVAPTMLSLGVSLLALGLPQRAALRVRDSIDRHADALARELTEIFQEDVWPAYRSAGVPISQVQDAVDSFRPLTVQGFIAAYERSVNAAKRSVARRRTGPSRDGE